MEAFLVSFTTVALAEVGDRTQLLSLVLAARFRRPWPMIAAIFVATLANHLAAGFIGVTIGKFLSPVLLDGVVGASLIIMAWWTLTPEATEEESEITGAGVFFATLVAFFLAEIGDKTQIATVALAAGYGNLPVVVAGTTSGILAANIPVVLAGSAFASKIPIRALHYVASGVFAVIGLVFIARAITHIV